MPPQTDYAKLAAQHGGKPVPAKAAPSPEISLRISASDQPVDYGALAREMGGQAVHPDSAQTAPATFDPFGGYNHMGKALTDGVIGAAKGAANTVIGLGRVFYDHVPGVGAISDAAQRAVFGDAVPAGPMFDAAKHEFATPTNTAQRIGYGAEQMAEYFVPAGRAEKLAARVAAGTPRYLRIFPEMAAQAGAGGAVATAQGQDPTAAAVSGAAMPVVGRPVSAGLRWAAGQAEPLARAAIKPTVTAMRRVAGASQTGLDAQAEKLVQFVLENKLTTPTKARALFDQTEVELRALLSGKNAPTDEPARVLRYLQALERSASKQRLPAGDVAAIRNAAAELLEGSLGETKLQMVPQLHPTLVNPQGQPITVLVPQPYRVMRASTPADEALEAARSSGRWQTRKQWGEQKGTDIEVRKTVERAGRDAVKAAVPESAPLLRRESQALLAEEVLDRMAFRAANRDAVSLPAHVVAAGEIASGRVPIVAFAANWLRNNQLKAGIWAHALRKGIESNNGRLTGEALRRLGVAVPAEVAGSR